MLPTKANTSPLGSGSEFKGEGESRFTEEGRDKERERPPVSDRALKPQRAWPSMSATQTGDWGGGSTNPNIRFRNGRGGNDTPTTVDLSEMVVVQSQPGLDCRPGAKHAQSAFARVARVT